MFDEENIRVKIADYGHSDKLRLYDDEIVELDDLILELYDIEDYEAFFHLYLDYEDYLDNDEECSESANEGNSINDMCEEDTEEIEIDAVNADEGYVDIYLDDYAVIQYYSGYGNEFKYVGYSCVLEDKKEYDYFSAMFYPYMDTLNDGVDLEGREFFLLGYEAKIKDIDPDSESILFEMESERYKLVDGDDFEYKEKVYDVDLIFDDGGLLEILLRPD